jgi:hypothetical protein
MKGLRVILIFALVALLVAGSVGTVYAKGGKPSDVPKGPKFQGEKQGFSGNVTKVWDGNVTIKTEQGWIGNVTLKEKASYKIPSLMNNWGNLTVFKSYLEGGTLSALEGRRVVVLAGNDSGTWEALKLLLLPAPGIQPLHIHRTGNVTEFNPKPGGNITIVDVNSVNHTFTITNAPTYRPQGIDEPDIETGCWVTVVSTGQAPYVVKAIVLHSPKPEDWPKQKP